MWKPLLCVAAISLLAPASASALSGKPILIGTSDDSATPAVVVDASGLAYVAWTVSATGDEPNPDEIGYCTIPTGTTSCSASGLLSAGPGNPAIGSVTLTIDGPDVVLVADQFQHSDDEADNYVNEWTAPIGSAGFTAVDDGESVTQGQGYGGDALFTLPNAGSLGGPLGYGYSSIGDNNGSYYTSVISPFNAPPTCSEATQDAADSDQCPQTPTALMPAPGEASSQAPNYYATENGSTPGVLGVFHSLFASECGQSTAGLSFVYGSGDESPTRSYGITPGDAGSAWRGDPTIFDCAADLGVPVGGSAGLGALTDDSAKTDVLHYRPFDQSTGAFGTPVSVDASEDSTISDLSGAEDGADGMFATYYDGNSIYKGPDELSYSPDGGKIWDGPVALTNLSSPLQESVSDVGDDGDGWLVWTTENKNGLDNQYNLYVQQFGEQDVPADTTALSSKQTRGAKSGVKLTIADGETGEFDTASLRGINAKYATGKVFYSLLRGSCTHPSATGDYGTITLHNGVIDASKKVTTALAPGKYFWVVKYGGDRNNATVTSKCGAAELTVQAPPHS
jgi:hypothetical protein